MFSGKLKSLFGGKKEIREFNRNEELKRIYKIFQDDPGHKWIIGRREALKIYKTTLRDARV